MIIIVRALVAVVALFLLLCIPAFVFAAFAQGHAPITVESAKVVLNHTLIGATVLEVVIGLAVGCLASIAWAVEGR